MSDNIQVRPAHPFYKNAVNRMTAKLKLNPIEVYEGNVDNALATRSKASLVDFGRPVIVYNRFFMEDMMKENKWAVYFVLAHEVAHHYNKDLHGNFMFTHRKVDERAHRKELNADYVVAWILRCEGATLAETLAFYNVIDDSDSYTHPSASKRRNMAIKGWNGANCKITPPKLITRPTPKPLITFGDVLFGLAVGVATGAAINAIAKS